MSYQFNIFTGELDLVNNTTSSGGSQTVELFVLTPTEVSNKFITLSATPAAAAETILMVKDAPSLYYGDDFTISGAVLSWNSLALDGILSSGDKLTVIYST